MSRFFGSIGPILVCALFLATPAGAQGLRGQPPARAASDPQDAPLIAPPAACPLEETMTAGAEAQEQAMLCMIIYARREAGLAGVVSVESLTSSADQKSHDLIACEEFSHYACGRPFSYWIRAVGYTSAPCWRIGEVIAFGRGEYGTPRAIFIAWMQSPTHRHIILNEFTQVGVSTRLGSLGGYGRVRVWAGHFGTQCEPA
jgi:uncharacterized protein YkwD